MEGIDRQPNLFWDGDRKIVGQQQKNALQQVVPPGLRNGLSAGWNGETLLDY